jgi:hypothetical protein
MAELSPLPPELLQAAREIAGSLWRAVPLAQLSAEQWQLLLSTVERRMRVRGVLLPGLWWDAMARDVGRPHA